jgi:hypothetical protein
LRIILELCGIMVAASAATVVVKNAGLRELWELM